ncbi:hypothetical protein PSTG_03351 [Puccinia striiformis f. sp. tritici PST-78]|uniref:hAT-like transposase RNase-H fold domain-containing protein n=1 Tax=Puccinia striiformis f. sp. tritici PST-78 TaxID=1165861 RepID=A0A0L0VVW4_9BASI|nr:hypothetical protein PSTG_03351 [Puccinia striiformis f. sp. tritici PST-78]
MASEVNRLLIKKTGIDPNLLRNHIRCVCHKIALIINAGLQSIQLSTRGLVLTQFDEHGSVPRLAPILEESKHVEEVVEVTVEDVLVGSDSTREEHYNNDDVLEANEDEHPDSWETSEEGKNPVNTILKSGSPPLQSNDPSILLGERTSKSMHPASLLDTVVDGTSSKKAGIGHLNLGSAGPGGGEKLLQQHEWEVVNQLNKILSEFYFVTKKMKGDNSSACLMILEYRKLVSFIEKDMENSIEPEFKTMLFKMLTKTRTYLKEAMRCDAVIIATILNPSFCLSIFKVSFPSHHDSASELIWDIFEVGKVEVDGAPESSLNNRPRRMEIKMDPKDAKPIKTRLIISLKLLWDLQMMS